jgi:NTP pyrophosphatase (non-canonical NTP hydrolase)
MTHFNKLTPAETERLDCLAEECAEGIVELAKVIKQISKIKRHGYEDSFQGMLVNNRGKLEEELGDIRYWMITMCEKGDLSKEAIHKAADAKALRANNWTHHQEKI